MIAKEKIIKEEWFCIVKILLNIEVKLSVINQHFVLTSSLLKIDIKIFNLILLNQQLIYYYNIY